MSEEAVVTPPVEPAPVPPADAPAVLEGQQPAATPDPPKEPEKKTPWFQTRIDQITREKHEQARRAEAAEAELQRLRQPQQPAPINHTPPFPQPGPSPQDVQRIAAEMVRQQQFDAKCNDVFSKGTSDFPDFQQVLGNFNMIGGLGEHRTMVEAVTQLDAGHKVLHHLGSHLDEAMRIASLPPVQQAVELTRLEVQLRAKASPAVSQAPAPPAPLNGGAGGGGGVVGPDSNGEFKDQASFRAWRDKTFKRR